MPTSINYSQLPQSASRAPPKPSQLNTKNFFRGFLIFSILVIATVITLYFTTDVFKKTTAIPVITTVTSGAVTTTTVTSTTVTSTTITTTTVTTSNYCENDTYCRNGANCVNALSGGGKQCDCLPGFNGTDCGNDINDCLRAGESCNNRGRCIDGYGNLNSSIFNYTCECDAGFEGEFCETNINDCLPAPNNPCREVDQNATCTDGINNVTCTCSDPATYSGPFCQSVSTTSTTVTTTTFTTTTITTTTDTTVTTNTLSTSTVSTTTTATITTTTAAQQLNSCDWASCATECSVEACGSGCYRNECAESCNAAQCGKQCSGTSCASSCMGSSCAEKCTGKACARNCIGDGCGKHCIGENCAEGCAGTNCGAGCAHPPNAQCTSTSSNVNSIEMGKSCSEIHNIVTAAEANYYDPNVCDYLNHDGIWLAIKNISSEDTYNFDQYVPNGTEQCYLNSANECVRTTLNLPILMCTLPGTACDTPGMPKCTYNRKCGKCQGHCTSNNDCAGTLQCYYASQHSTKAGIPGCSSDTPDKYYTQNTGYCYDPSE